MNTRGIRAEITWLPHRAEYAPWSIRRPAIPDWANIIHVNTWLHRSLVPASINTVATAHHSVHDPALRPFKTWLQALYHRLWIKSLERWILRRADRVVAVSQYTAHQVQATFGTEGIEVIYNGLDTDQFHPPAARDPHQPFRLLYVGSWSARKGCDLLAPIMQKLGEDFELHYTCAVKSTANTDLPANCHPLGRPSLAGLINAYQECDALLFPSRLEGFGQVAAEAMACGLPVIAANNSALPEVVLDHKTGLLVRQNTAGGFADAARALQTDPVTWRRMSSTARDHAAVAFAVDRMADQYVKIYSSMLSQQKS